MVAPRAAQLGHVPVVAAAHAFPDAVHGVVATAARAAVQRVALIPICVRVPRRRATRLPPRVLALRLDVRRGIL